MNFLTRNHFSFDGKTDGIVKIGCFGDSMMHGAGVSPKESLPARLEAHVNQDVFDRLFFVENWGVRGYNIWDSIELAKSSAATAGFDAIVVSISHNDCNMLENHSSIRTPRGAAQSAVWSTHRDELSRTLTELADWSRAQGIPVTLMWLGGHAWERPIVRLIEELAQEQGLPLLDSLAVFDKLCFEADDPRLFVSTVDTHLSALALDMAGRALARHLARQPWLETTPAWPDPSAGILHAVETRQATDAQRMTAIGWAARTCMLKQNRLRRMVAVPDRDGMRKAFVELSDRLDTAFGRLSRRLGHAATVAALHRTQRDLAVAGVKLASAAEAAAVACFTPRPAFAASVLAEEAVQRRLSLFPHCPSRLNRKVERLRHLLDRFLFHKDGNGDHPVQTPFTVHLRTLASMMRTTVARLAAGTGADDGCRRLAARELETACDIWLRVLYGLAPEPAAIRCRPDIWSKVNIHIRVPKHVHKTQLWLRLDVRYQVPELLDWRDDQILLDRDEGPADTDRILFQSFEIPLLLSGEIDIAVVTAGDAPEPLSAAIIDRIEVTGLGKARRIVTWHPDWASGPAVGLDFMSAPLLDDRHAICDGDGAGVQSGEASSAAFLSPAVLPLYSRMHSMFILGTTDMSRQAARILKRQKYPDLVGFLADDADAEVEVEGIPVLSLDDMIARGSRVMEAVVLLTDPMHADRALRLRDLGAIVFDLRDFTDSVNDGTL